VQFAQDAEPVVAGRGSLAACEGSLDQLGISEEKIDLHRRQMF